MLIRTHFRPGRKVIRAVATTRTGRRVQKSYAAGQFLTQHRDAIFALDAAAEQLAGELLSVADPVVSFDHETRLGFAYRVTV
jgi:hypothetical protein